jgi:hypothetical protein
MTQQLSPYHHRVPRYVLLPQDNCLIRLAGPKQIPWEEGTEIKDISTTGLSFTAASDLSPNLGETIRVEFTVPGSKQMACFARVVRLQTLNECDNLIAIEFELLNGPQRINLQQGLSPKVSEEQESAIETKPKLPFGLKLIFYISITISLFCSAFLLFTLYRVLTQPDWISSIFEKLSF